MWFDKEPLRSMKRFQSRMYVFFKSAVHFFKDLLLHFSGGRKISTLY